MLIDSLLLSQLMYVLSAWGHMMTKSQTNRLQCLHNWGNHITVNLWRSDYVTHRRKKLIGYLLSNIVLCVS